MASRKILFCLENSAAIFLCGFLICAASVALHAQDWNYPSDAPLLDITKFGADPTGAKDATAAIQEAIDSTREMQFRIRYVYIPKGTYKVSKELVTDRYVTIVGQNREQSIIKLVDNASGFTSAGSPKAVLKMGMSMNMSFGVYASNFSIDLGSGNAGAIGLDFVAHNIGAARKITIKGDSKAYCGMRVGRGSEFPGPCLQKDIKITGCVYGIVVTSSSPIHHATFEHIELSGQTSAGFHLKNGVPVSIRKLHSTNSVPAIDMTSCFGLALIESECTGGSSGNAAIKISKSADAAYIMDLKTSGYGSAIDHGGKKVAGPNITDWCSQEVHTLFNNPKKSFRFDTIMETPDYTPADFPDLATQWQNVDMDPDIAMEDAVKNKKPVVYFQDPGGQGWTFFGQFGSVTIPSQICWINGMGQTIGDLWADPPENAAWVIEGTAKDPPLVIERLQGRGHGQQLPRTGPEFLHKGSRTVVLKSIGGNYKAEPGAGMLFLEDFVGLLELAPGQRVYARQLNTEDLSEDQSAPMVDVNGAAMWVLGQKTEGYKTMFKVYNGGICALYGACYYHTKASTAVPLFESIDANIFTCSYWIAGSWPYIAYETRDGTKKTLNTPTRNFGAYSGWIDGTLKFPPITPTSVKQPESGAAKRALFKSDIRLSGNTVEIGPKAGDWNLRYIDMLGREACKLSGKGSFVHKPAGMLSAGTYLVKFSGASSTTLKAFIGR